MEKKRCFFVALLIMTCFISLNLVAAAGTQVSYQVVGEKVLVEINMDSVSNLELNLPYNYEALESNVDYELLERTLKIQTGGNVEIKYITDSMIDKSKNYYYFVSADPIKDADISLYLPEGAVLCEPRVLSPTNAQMSTDGRRVILRWNDLKDEQIVVSYGFIEEDDWHYLVIIGVLATILIITHFFNKRRFRKEIKRIRGKSRKRKGKSGKEEELTKNLFEDEKKIVEYLLTKKGNECWTKEIVKDLGISKVKLSRKLRSLVAKEIIKKLPYGNENKIRLIK